MSFMDNVDRLELSLIRVKEVSSKTASPSGPFTMSFSSPFSSIIREAEPGEREIFRFVGPKWTPQQTHAPPSSSHQALFELNPPKPSTPLRPSTTSRGVVTDPEILLGAALKLVDGYRPMPRKRKLIVSLFEKYEGLKDSIMALEEAVETDRALAVGRVAANGTGIKSSKFEWHQAKAALLDPKAWLLTIAMFGSSVPNGILTNFSGPIIKGMGFSTLNAALLDCAGRSLQIISLLIAGYFSTKFESCRIIMVTIGNLVCVLGSCLMAFLPFSQTWPRLVGFWLINCQSIGFTLGLVMISSNIGGYTKRSMTSTMVFIGYCVGNILGPQFVFENEAPVYRSAAYAMLASYGGKTVCHALLGVYMLMSNRKRDSIAPADPKRAADLGMQGKTEDENSDFRYVL